MEEILKNKQINYIGTLLENIESNNYTRFDDDGNISVNFGYEYFMRHNIWGTGSCLVTFDIKAQKISVKYFNTDTVDRTIEYYFNQSLEDGCVFFKELNTNKTSILSDDNADKVIKVVPVALDYLTEHFKKKNDLVSEELSNKQLLVDTSNSRYIDIYGNIFDTRIITGKKIRIGYTIGGEYGANISTRDKMNKTNSLLEDIQSSRKGTVFAHDSKVNIKA